MKSPGKNTCFFAHNMDANTGCSRTFRRNKFNFKSGYNIKITNIFLLICNLYILDIRIYRVDLGWTYELQKKYMTLNNSWKYPWYILKSRWFRLWKTLWLYDLNCCGDKYLLFMIKLRKSFTINIVNESFWTFFNTFRSVEIIKQLSLEQFANGFPFFFQKTFPFNFVPHAMSFGSKLKLKLSQRSYFIQFEKKSKTIFLRVVINT